MNLLKANKRCKNYLRAEGYFDPCHNWAHTGILIQKAMIKLTPDLVTGQWVAGHTEKTQDGEITFVPEEFLVQDKDPNIAVVKAFITYLDSKSKHYNHHEKEENDDDDNIGNRIDAVHASLMLST
jgi:hypothetical protein|tara:strand:+ start:592 stop:966 length:375 start_codon:yes stop_codon:yes gene_type:complete